MNKKIIFFLSFLLMVSFSAGIFVQFLSSDQVILSTADVSFFQALWSGCKSDLTIAAAALLLSATLYTVPLLLILVTGQVFTLGFSASYLLAAHPQGIPIVCAVLLPRCLLKLPAYMALVILAFDRAKSRRSQNQRLVSWREYTLSIVFLMCSSLLEAVLHLLIVSP